MADPVPTGDSVPLLTSGTNYTLINGLTQGGSWVFSGAQDFTYSFHVITPDSSSEWTATLKGYVAQAYAAWAAVANITFTEDVTVPVDYKLSDADLTLTFAGADPDILAYGIFPDPSFADLELAFEGETRVTYPQPEGDIFIFEESAEQFDYMQPGGAGFGTILHEIGHTLGLKHPFDDGGNDRPVLSSFYDDGYKTLMSYEDPQLVDNGFYITYATGFQATPMPLDILAIQHIYGANMTTNAGDNTYVLTDDGIVRTIWDAGGTDTIDASGLSAGLRLTIVEGDLMYYGTYSATAIAYNMTLENITGTGFNDTIAGNAADNILNGDGGADVVDGGAGADTITGGIGNDSLIGNSGADTMTGGVGNDTFNVDDGTDKVIESLNEGTDAVRSSVSFDLSVNGANIENLTLLSLPAAIAGIGNDLNNTLTGNSYNNTLDGGIGTDIMNGGAGNDTYDVDNIGDAITDGSGVDTVRSSIDYVLGIGLENLILAGSSDIDATGNSSVNILTGNSGDNVFDGGAGNDTITGGLGDDTYIVTAAGDVITELLGEGIDTVSSSVTWILTGDLDNLILTGTAANGTGNALANIITGNGAANSLDGGIGADSLTGGTGNDTYFVDNAGDVVTETSAIAAEIDTIKSTTDVILGAYVENLIILTGGHSGTGNGPGEYADRFHRQRHAGWSCRQ
jgi:serralysin